MARAVLPSPGLRAGVPRLEARWYRWRARPRDLDAFCALAGIETGPELPFLYLQVTGFRLQMALLTQPRFPLPIWTVLQVRNRLLQHRPIARAAALDLETVVSGHRLLDKGLEVDLHLVARDREAIQWESVNTFYVRGRFGAAGVPSPFAAAPRVDGPVLAAWKMPANGRLRYGALTGDYNGVHLSDWYARRLGFTAAFLHPQRVLAQCLARLPASGIPRRLDAWLKGPVPYGVGVTLRGAPDGPENSVFALTVEGSGRPAIVARLLRTASGTSRLDSDC